MHFDGLIQSVYDGWGNVHKSGKLLKNKQNILFFGF
jgi:hypothetical protein